MSLNQDQRDVADKFFDFMLSPEKEFYLFGSGGTGKTYLVKYLMSEGKKKYEESCKLFSIPLLYRDYLLTATTNKAAQVLSFFSGAKTNTIYSLFKVVVQDNYSNGKTELVPSDPGHCIRNSVIFIDECSMLGRQMLSWIRTHSPDCKIVYVGDPYQLAPVNEKPYWSMNASSTVGLLSKLMRNINSPALQKLSEQMKEYVRTKQKWNISLVPGTIELLDDNEMQKKLEEHFITNPQNSKILAYTNSKCLQYIDWLNKKQNRNALFMVKDKLINTSSIEVDARHRLYPDQELLLIGLNEKTQIYAGNATVHVHMGTLKDNQGCIYRRCPIALNPEELKNALKVLAKQKDWKHYFDLKNNILDLRPANALTIHKAQGSSYDTVFIDLDSFKSCKAYDTAARLLYVAVSRARQKVYFYGSLPERLGRIT